MRKDRRMVKHMIKESSPIDIKEFEEIAQLGSFELDLVDRSWSASKNFCHIFGLKFPRKLQFQELKQLMHPDYYELAIEKFDNCIKTGQPQFFECICFDADQHPLYMECRIRLNTDNHGYPTVQGILQDISHRKVNEQRLNDLVQMNRVKDEVLAIVAHDLKSPINQIGGILNLLKSKGELNSEEYLKYIENACGVASHIINDLIEISEMSESGYSLSKSKININNLIKATISSYELPAKEKGLTVLGNLCEEAYAFVHPLKISRVMDNLISNAIKFSYPKGKIEISSQSLEDSIIIKVRDYGIGIPKEKLPFIFDKFSTARQSGTQGEKSTGLGLNIVKKILKMHNGQVKVLSQERQGSEFIVELPKYST